MKTDDLVAALSTRIEPVDRRLMSWTMGIAFLATTLVALCLVHVGLGIRADLMTARALTFLVLKLAFAVAVVGVSSIYLVRLARPGGERRTSSIRIIMPFVAIVLLAARAKVALGRDGHGRSMARMPALRSGDRDRAFCDHCRCDAKCSSDQSGASGRFRRSHCRRHERAGLCSSLNRRFTAIYCALVCRNDFAVHTSRCSTGATAVALVDGRVGRLHVGVNL